MIPEYITSHMKVLSDKFYQNLNWVRQTFYEIQVSNREQEIINSSKMNYLYKYLPTNNEKRP